MSVVWFVLEIGVGIAVIVACRMLIRKMEGPSPEPRELPETGCLLLAGIVGFVATWMMLRWNKT